MPLLNLIATLWMFVEFFSLNKRKKTGFYMKSINDIDNYIKETYEISRTVPEFISYVEDCLYLPRKLGIKHFDFGNSRLLKLIREEAYPLVVLLEEFIGMAQQVKMFNGNQNYDGILTKGNVSTKVEVTCAIDGNLNSWQSKMLDKFGSAPITGIVANDIRDGLNRNEVVYSQAVSTQDIFELIFPKIVEVINKKESKTYSADTILIVSVSDGLFYEEECWDQFCRSVQEACLKTNFQSIYLVSTFPKLAYHLNLGF